MTQPTNPTPRHNGLRRGAALLLLATIAVPAVLAAAVAWGGPAALAPLSSINEPFRGLDYSNLPHAQHIKARDGTSLA